MRLLVALALCALAACREAPRGAAPVPADTLRYAEGFRLLSEGGVRVAEVVQRGGARARFVLVPHGQAPPAGVAGTVVRVPVRRIVALSTTHLGLLARVGAADAIAGVAGTGWVNTPAVRAGLQSGRIADVGEPGVISTEAIAAARPDVVFAEEGGETARALAPLGVPVVPIAEYLEPHPLGRAEWMRFVAAFTGQDAEAKSAFDSTAARYERLRDRIAATSARPRVLVNTPFQGVWYVPGGQNFLVAYLRDAGADYPWAADTGRASLALSLEDVLTRAQDASVWLNVPVRTRAEVLAMDRRLGLFAAFRNGQLYSHAARLSPGGGYDYFETGTVEPDVILAELVSILRPGFAPGRELVYYRKVE
jgi:iron complex transport system substrate-binding protein